MARKEINNRFCVKSRLRSFKFALNGLKILFKEEHNARIHLTAACIVIILGIWLNISSFEWLVICLLIGMVIVAEIINSSIENLADYVSPEWHEAIKKTKDLAAAAVLVAALIAVICGIIIFLPKLCDFLL